MEQEEQVALNDCRNMLVHLLLIYPKGTFTEFDVKNMQSRIEAADKVLKPYLAL